MHFTVQTVLVKALYCTNCVSECTLLVNALYCTNCISECALLYKLY